MEQAFCDQCGAAIETSARFCESCGAPVEAPDSSGADDRTLRPAPPAASPASVKAPPVTPQAVAPPAPPRTTATRPAATPSVVATRPAPVTPAPRVSAWLRPSTWVGVTLLVFAFIGMWSMFRPSPPAGSESAGAFGGSDVVGVDLEMASEKPKPAPASGPERLDAAAEMTMSDAEDAVRATKGVQDWMLALGAGKMGRARFDVTDDGPVFTVHVYEVVPDDSGSHNATQGWYEVSKVSRKVKALMP